MSNDVHPAIADHYQGMNDALHERDKLAALVIELQSKLAISDGINKHLKEQLDKVSAERNYYIRKSLSYTTTLVNMRNTVQNMLDLADHEAENSAPAKLPRISESELIDGN